MNSKLVVKTLGRILSLEALFMILPLIISRIYHESIRNTLSFGIVVVTLVIIGIISIPIKIDDESFRVKDGFVIVALSWIFMSIFGALPFVISGEIPSFVDAVFETASGFTTTGASILTDVEKLSHSMVFWRSFTHFIGGMGILVFALAVLPKTKGAVNVMRAEVPGPVFGKLVSKLHITAKILYEIYIVMTVALIIILMIAGMDIFDAALHAFGTAGTGGFSNRGLSIAYYNSPAIEYILTIGMIVFGVNFNLYYLILIGRAKDLMKSIELKVYLALWILSFSVIAFRVAGGFGGLSHKIVRDAMFSTASIMTTTGYATADFAQWDMFSQYILLLLMFVGACAGSTAGGLKTSRVITLFKSGFNGLKRALNPKRILVVSEDGKVMSDYIIREVLVYFFLYICVFMSMLGLVLLDCSDFTTAFSSVAATLNNIGPGLAKVGPSENFAMFHPITKIGFTLTMIIGRLEIIPVLVLFIPSTWKRI